MDTGRWKAVPGKENSMSKGKLVILHSWPLIILVACYFRGCSPFTPLIAPHGITANSLGKINSYLKYLWCLFHPFWEISLVSDHAVTQSPGTWGIILNCILQVKLTQVYSIQIPWDTNIKFFSSKIPPLNQPKIN